VEAASPDLEKQGFSSVVFIYQQYSEQQEDGFLKTPIILLLKKLQEARQFVVNYFVSHIKRIRYRNIHFF